MKKKKEALCVVAHPDDETIWMGGTILKNKDFNWTILSLCRKNDLDRAPKFRKVCKFYGAKSIISDLEDEKIKPLPVSLIIKKIKDVLSKKNYNFIFTHGGNGEYGHLRHIEIHKAVKKMIKDKSLFTKEMYYFSYELRNSKIPSPKSSSDFIINLNEKEYKDKVNLITKFYGFSKSSFESKSCNKIETFTKS